MSHVESTHDRLIATYRKKAKHYNVTSRLYPVPGYPQQTQRRRAIKALELRPGDTVVDVACGTGQNFPFLEQAIGPEGRIVGVDLTDAMLAEAQDRVEANGWRNVSLIQSDAVALEFPSTVDAILSTYALTQVTGCADVIAHGAAALQPGRRWTVLDLKLPDSVPRRVARLGISSEWIARRPWEEIRAAMEAELVDVSWNELFCGTAFVASGRTR